METIYDIMHNLAKYPAILGGIILEESQQINQHIKNNITKLGVLSLEYYEYIPSIIIPTIITMLLVMLSGFIVIYKNTKTKKTASANANANANTSVKNANNTKLNNKPVMIKKGLYLESVKELNTVSKNIVNKFEKGQTYWVLIRVQMRDYINMAGTKFELHGNNINPETANTNEAFQTKDAYLILKFRIINDIKEESLVGNVIIQFMNDLNHGEFITNDFIICAIGTSPNIDANEFNNGLKHINYELENNLQVNKKIYESKIVDYNLLLPIHQVYDLFMDVYNICIFESTKYVIDNENYESWNGKSINELVF